MQVNLEIDDRENSDEEHVVFQEWENLACKGNVQ